MFTRAQWSKIPQKSALNIFWATTTDPHVFLLAPKMVFRRL